MRFSIVIPNYNSEKWINKCLDSILNQTFKDFEVIIVNDCSKDDSEQKLYEYAEKSNLKMRIISNEINRGPGYSRNVGVQAAEGTWLSFCDADDWYSYDRLEKLLSATEEDTDLVFCNLKRVYNTGKEVVVDYVSDIMNLDNHVDIVALALRSFDFCLIKAEISKKISIADLYNGEDYATMPLWVQNSKKIAFVKDALYSYFTRQGSLSVKPSPNAYLNFKKAFEYMKERSDEAYKDAVEYIGVYSVLYGGVLSALKAKIHKKEVITYIDWFTEQYPDWIENSYIKKLSKFKRCFLKFVYKKKIQMLRLMAFAHSLIMKLR